MSSNICPKTYLVEAILATIFCCLPLGIVAIVKASGVSSAFASGNHAEAQRLSEEAGKWAKYALFAGLAGVVLYVIYLVIVFVSVASMA